MQNKNLINSRILLTLAHDLLAISLAWIISFNLRFNFQIPSEYYQLLLNCILFVILVQIVFLYLFNLYRGTWRFVSISDLSRIITAVGLASLSLILIFSIFDINVPYSVIILDSLLLILIMGGSRFLYRIFREGLHFKLYKSSMEPIIILSSGFTSFSFLKDLLQSKKWIIVGILDDDKSIHGREINGVRIHGSIDDLGKIAQKYKAKHVLISMPSIDHIERRRVFNLATDLGLMALTVPSFDDLINGRPSITQIRPVNLNDLLGRDSVDLDNTGLKKLISNNPVFVSGAGGSIGSELCRQIIRFKPSYLICFDISEYGLYRLEEELAELHLSTKISYIIGDIKNSVLLDKLLKDYKFSLVFHAAAYKHVPLMENVNVSEAFNNNVLGTYILGQACKKANVKKFVLVSSDKAVNPTNIMGSTKRLAEIVCQGLQDKIGTRFIIVRFGNVLGSSGSVIPKFSKQIKSGGPITVTHPEITRYFMSIPEASQLVMQAGLMGKGGEVFILDMGEPVRIIDLAKEMIKLSGFDIDEIPIKFTGLRPGEKLYEELLLSDEHSLKTPHEKLRIASAKKVNKKWIISLLSWISTLSDKDEVLIKEELKFWLEEYQGDINYKKFY